MKGGSGKSSDPSSSSWILFALAPVLLLVVGCQEQIVHDLSEREANSVISQLSMARLDARKVRQADGRWAISVNKGEMVPALAYIETRRVLTTRDASSASNKGGMIPSREEQWFRYERSVSLSIEESLSALPGVLDARVHVNLPDDDPLFGDSARKGGSASVLLVVDQRFGADDAEVAALVGGAAGLQRDVVRVLKSETVDRDVSEVLEKPETSPSSVSEGAPSPASWRFVVWGFGVAILFGVCARFGVCFRGRRSKRRVTFELPKELDFEG